MIKLSDIMLDLATGDASKYDAYIQEACGQVKVASAIYDAASQIAELNDSEREEIVQEAYDANLPSDKEGAIDLAYESTARELIGTVRHLYTESALILESYTSTMSPVNLITTIAKNMGMNIKPSFTKECAEAVAVAVVKNKERVLSSGCKFIKASKARTATKNCIDAIGLLANMVGIDTSDWFEDPIVSFINPSAVQTKIPKGETLDLNQISGVIKNANELLAKATISESDYTTTVTKNDVATHMSCLFALTTFAKRANINIGGKGESSNGSKIEKKIQNTINKAKKSRSDGGAIKGINGKNDSGKSNIVSLNTSLTSVVNGLRDAFNSSLYSLAETLNKG